ncbi:N-acetylmuramoyl-L-alanine amidase [Candidatus Blochmannia ocreatus (nom. nud.)]|uniref:N-acetylmuramoyl-L-alanine amidase n=1 Tax=Candidatus Blochmannia ocreatus (nom. nud.) TaxID=251538 RepID=A0ABY4SUS9_9ENTR|nr:N-acetylmuramoyl-L-alanine amidase [Candidatus Blochmannia ocreatus]URJ25164.1 N-acetylmuramoyl-L-alanine amidase [Candidatus Blochmannia ocreatus]
MLEIIYVKLKYEIIYLILFLLNFLCIESISASNLNAIAIINCATQAIVILDYSRLSPPGYVLFPLHKPERIVIDLSKKLNLEKNMFPMYFNGTNLIKCVRTNTVNNFDITRIVLDLTYPACIETIQQKKIKEHYRLMLKILKQQTSGDSKTCLKVSSPIIKNNSKTGSKLDAKSVKHQKQYTNIEYNNITKNYKKKLSVCPIVVAIDAGHGGQDPGATSIHRIYEKNITFGIAGKLKALLDADPKFKAVMIRDGDYFISVKERADIARKKLANVLISIHADAAKNTTAHGASVWVLSDSRAKSEMMNWLKCREKYSELLGGLGDVLTNYSNYPYFNHLILDVQFSYAQQVGYDLALEVLYQLKTITGLHKKLPVHSNFGVLRSPDIPSILVETGFISNLKEARLLVNSKYQAKIANALYKGLKNYFYTSKKNVPTCSTYNKNTYITAS